MVDLRKAAAIVGIYEHPARFAPDKSELLVQAESVIGALADAGLEKKDVDGLFSSSMSVRMANVSLADYMDLYPKHLDDTSVGGASFEFHLGHAVNAIAAGRIDVAVITYSTCRVREASPSAPAAPLDWGRLVCIPRPTASRSFTGSPLWASTLCWPSVTCTSTAPLRSSWQR